MTYAQVVVVVVAAAGVGFAVDGIVVVGDGDVDKVGFGAAGEPLPSQLLGLANEAGAAAGGRMRKELKNNCETRDVGVRGTVDEDNRAVRKWQRMGDNARKGDRWM